MIRNKHVIVPACTLFILFEIWFSYQIQTVAPNLICSYQYSSVVLACIFGILFFELSLKYAFTQIALVFTVLADYFLVYLDEIDQLNGMICFSFVQIAYFARIMLEDENKKRRKIHIYVRTALSAVAMVFTFAVLQDKADALAVVSVFYYANLVLNLIFAFINFKKIYLMAFGFVFFILCDTVIGLACIGPYITIPEGSFIHILLHPGFDPAWAFYVPSYTLLSISLLPNRLQEQEKRV